MKAIRIGLFAVIAVVMLLPLWMMVSGSVQHLRYVFVMPPRLIPWEPTLQNYMQLLEKSEVLRWTKNSLLVVGLTIGVTLCVTSCAGYGFAVYEFSGRRAIMTGLLLLIMIPGQVLILPTFVLLRTVGVATSYFAAIAPRVLSVMGIYLFVNYIRQIPKCEIESGRIDGASELRIMTQLILPQCKPAFAVIALFYGVMAWQDFLWQLLTLREHRTLIVGLLLHLRQMTTATGDMASVSMALAIGTIMFVPLLLIYLCTARWFLYGLSLSGVRE